MRAEGDYIKFRSLVTWKHAPGGKERAGAVWEGVADGMELYEIEGREQKALFIALGLYWTNGAQTYCEPWPDANLEPISRVARGGKPHQLALERKPGNSLPGDGYRYQPRGFLPLCTRIEYEAIEADTGMAYSTKPEIAATDPYSAGLAGAFVYNKHCKDKSLPTICRVLNFAPAAELNDWIVRAKLKTWS